MNVITYNIEGVRKDVTVWWWALEIIANFVIYGAPDSLSRWNAKRQ